MALLYGYGATTRQELFRNLKKLGNDIGTETLFARLKRFSQLYSVVLTSGKEEITEWSASTGIQLLSKEYEIDQVLRHYEAMRMFGVTPSYPLVIKFKDFVSNCEGDTREKVAKAYLKLLNAIEKFHFANYGVCQRPGNEIEAFYANHCKEELSAENFVSVVTGIIKELKQKLVKRVEFSERFCELSYIANFALIYYVNDRLNNVGKKGGQYVQIFNSDKRLLRKNFDIEHLFAQDGSNYKFDMASIEESIHNIGNLIVISKHTNGSLGNKILSEKLPVILDKEKLAEAKVLGKEWGNAKYSSASGVEALIAKRAKSLGDRAFDFATKF